jgi:hypothetical protein
MFPGNYTNTTTISNGATSSPWTVNPPHQTGMLNGYYVAHAPSPSKRAGANRPGKWLHDMTDEERRGFLKRMGVKTLNLAPPVPIEDSMTSGAAGRKTPYEEVLERVRENYRYYLPNAIAYPLRALTALQMEALRWVIEPVTPAVVEETSNTDVGAAAAQVSASSSLRRLENAAIAFCQVMESEFGSGIAEQPVNATHQPLQDSQYREAVSPESKSAKEIISQIDYLPPIEDNRPCLVFDDLMKRIDGEFRLYGQPDRYSGQPIQGKIVVISPVYYDSLDFIRDLLNDVSRSDDILLRTSHLEHHVRRSGVPNEVDLDENGLPTPNISASEDRDCLGIHSSRCLVWDLTPQSSYPDVNEYNTRELASEMYQVAADTIARHPTRTVFVVTDSLTAAEFMRWSNNRPGAAMRLEQLASTVATVETGPVTIEDTGSLSTRPLR